MFLFWGRNRVLRALEKSSWPTEAGGRHSLGPGPVRGPLALGLSEPWWPKADIVEAEDRLNAGLGRLSPPKFAARIGSIGGHRCYPPLACNGQGCSGSDGLREDLHGVTLQEGRATKGGRKRKARRKDHIQLRAPPYGGHNFICCCFVSNIQSFKSID